MPLWVMDAAVDEWIQETREANGITGTCTYTSGTPQFGPAAILTSSLVAAATVLLF